jgi:hypothetical protein
VIVEEIKNIKSGKSELRKFGVTAGVFLGLLGVLFLWREKDYYFYFPILSAVFFLLSLFAPMLLKSIHKIWMSLAILMGWFVTRLILTFLFYLVVTPIGLSARLFGKDFLALKSTGNETDSYWILRKESKYGTEHYESQF